MIGFFGTDVGTYLTCIEFDISGTSFTEVCTYVFAGSEEQCPFCAHRTCEEHIRGLSLSVFNLCIYCLFI